jgi:methylated-DNA-[protein]-cysteine S-methyltransferase
MLYKIIASTAGDITLCSNGTALTGLHLAGDRYFAGPSADWGHRPEDPLLNTVAAQLSEYFAGRRRHFDVPLAPAGTAFQLSVWTALQQLPAGRTTTYGELAAGLGRPGAARAVGTAIGRNPVCIIVPCHRVLAAGGGFGGYVAGIAAKQLLLATEGVTVHN